MTDNKTFERSPDDLASGIRRLEASALRAWGEQIRYKRWTLFVVLSFAHRVDEITAAKLVDDWIVQLKMRHPGAAVFHGVHTDSAHVHAHALVFIPRRWWRQTCRGGERVVRWIWGLWLRWPHGLVLWQFYSPGAGPGGGSIRGPLTDSSKERGAVPYIGKNLGTLMLDGTAPLYRPRLKRKRRKEPN